MKKNFKILITLIILITTISGCNSSEDIGKVNTEGSPQVLLSITQSYGKEEIFREKVDIIDNFTVYDVLNENTELGTDYGGGFVSSIEGVESTFGGPTGLKQDWFYYVNGICADVGAIDYELNDQDKIWWDYHQWQGMNSANSSVVGMYPEPFINGYRNKTKLVKILYTVDNIKEAEKLEISLRDLGAPDIEIIQAENEFIEKRECPTILIGEWGQIKNISYIKDLNDNHRKTGTYSLYSDNSLYLMNYKFEVMETIEEDYATINSYGEGLGDENPLWIITGGSTESTSMAVKMIVENPEKLELSYAIALIEERLIKLPVQ